MAEKEKTQKGNWFTNGLQSLIDGSFLTKGNFVKQLPFIFFLTFLAIIYIANVNRAEKTIRGIENAKHQVRELKAEYITVKSDLMLKINPTQIARKVEPIGLKPSLEPPRKIAIDKRLRQTIQKYTQ